jgi:hypothetical protein
VSKGLLARCLSIGVIVVGVSSVPAILLLGYVGYYRFLPSYSAVAYFENFGFNVRLDLYRTDETKDSGRYLTIINGNGYSPFRIEGSDWQHRARTSIYRIDANHLAVLSAQGHDYTMTLQPFAFAPAVSDSGAQWQYLGAFDFVFPPNRKPRLEFVDPHSAECIAMGRIDPASWVTMPRPQARRASCPSPSPNPGE